VYNIGVPTNTHDNIARFEITVNEVARMDVLQAMELDIENISQSVMAPEVKLTHQLPGQEQNSLDRELKMTVDKEVLKRLAKAIDHHRVEASFHTKPICTRDTLPSIELCVDMKLVAQGVILAFNLLKFNDDVVS
jgi:hypothetical protein